ncbi:MAG: gliding motility-associated C-terminal domain-containing protein [Bacteroidota bacterium]
MKECLPSVYLPTAFSPNNDGVNDLFTPYFSHPDKLNDFHLSIFDRWGKLVYKSNSLLEPSWDGTVKGRPVSLGVYAWLLTYQWQIGEEIKDFTISGHVNAIR